MIFQIRRLCLVGRKLLYPHRELLLGLGKRGAAGAGEGECLLRLNHDPECEAGVNEQINAELHAGYTYLAMAYNFTKSSVALPGFAKMFMSASREEMEHAEKFMAYQNRRGGKIRLKDVKAPETSEWTPVEALLAAIQLEKDVTKSLEMLHKSACKNRDSHLCDFLDTEFLGEQYRTLKDLCDLKTKICRVGEDLGLFLLDQSLEKKYKDSTFHS